MAQKKVKFQGFVSVNLNKEERVAVKEMELTDGQIIEFWTHAAELGYKVSVSFSDKGEFYTVTLYGNHSENKNAGYAMSMRHKDMLVCIAAFYFLFADTSMGESWGERFDTDDNNDW